VVGPLLSRAALWLGRLFIELAPGRAQRGATALARAQLLRQLITARLPVELILAAVGVRGLFEDLACDAS
jgi:hypothetical protein